MEQIRNSAISLVLFFVLLFIYTKVAGPLPFSVNSVTTQKTTTFDVTGEGKTQAQPNLATVSAGVTAKGPDQKTVQDQMNKTINAVTDAVKAAGIDPKDIQTQNYSINPSYSFPPNGAQTQNGFEANTNLTIKVHDVSKVNAVIDAATASGATNVNNLGFETENNTDAIAQARKMAIADAKQKAQDAAQAAGFKLGKIVNFQENDGGNPPRPVPLMAAGAAQSTKIDTNVQAGTNEVDVTVTLSYEIN